MNKNLRLDIGTDQYISLEAISSEWYQVSEAHRCEYICKTGDMVRISTRGYEIFSSPQSVFPTYVLPNRTKKTLFEPDTSDEEE